MDSQETTPLAWHYMQLDVPADWEVIGFKKAAKTGELALSDRHGETMRVFWQQLPGTPALDERLIELVRTNTEDKLDELQIRKQLSDRHGWRVFMPENDELPAFAARYDPDGEAAVILTLPPHPANRQHQWTSRILASFRPNAGAERRWAAFGIDVTLPQEYLLESVSALPAAQVLNFETKKEHSITIHRYGMLPLVLAEDDLPTFFSKVKGRRCLLYRVAEFRRDGRYPGVRLRYRTRGKTGGFSSLIARSWHGRVWMWRCDKQMRFYCVDHHAPKKVLLDGVDKMVNCP